MLSGSTGTAAARYAALVTAREPFLIRAREAAGLTKPYLMPPLGFNSSMSLPTPYQSLGARGVRNLASKLLTSLFPTNTSFFKYEIDDQVLDQIAQRPDARGAFEMAMSRRERAIMHEINLSLFRAQAYVALEHLVVSGNGVIYAPIKGAVRFFRLDQFVVRRDPSGNLLELVIEEKINPATLTAEQQAALQNREVERDGDGDDNKDRHEGTGEKDVCLYTRCYLSTDGKWVVTQECQGILLPGTAGTYPADANPFLVLRWSSQPCEDYGRGYVEEFLGDLDSLEALSQTLVEGIAASARVLFLVKPNGVTRVKVVAEARNGDVKVGNAEDVTIVQSQHKVADFQTAQKQAEEIATRISYAFMLNSSIQRNAERVTAEEIKFMASDIDDALGGVYTLFSGEFQLPVVQMFERRMQKNRKVPPLPKGTAVPTITTGLQAIGRGNDLMQLKSFITDVIQVLTPQVAFQYLNPGEFLKRAIAAYSIDDGGLVKSDEQVQQEQQQAQQQAMVQQLAPHGIRAAGQVAAASMKQGNQNADQGQ